PDRRCAAGAHTTRGNRACRSASRARATRTRIGRDWRTRPRNRLARRRSRRKWRQRRSPPRAPARRRPGAALSLLEPWLPRTELAHTRKWWGGVDVGAPDPADRALRRPVERVAEGARAFAADARRHGRRSLLIRRRVRVVDFDGE